MIEGGTVHRQPGKWLVSITSILLGVTMAFAMVGLVLHQTLLNLAFHQELFAEEQMTEKVSALVPDLLINALLPDSTTPAVISSMIRDALYGIDMQLIPTSWVNAVLIGGTSNFITFMQSKEDVLSLQLDLRPIKQKLLDQTPQIADTVVSIMPQCTAAQLLSFAEESISGNSKTLPFCKPAEPFTSLIKPVVTASILGMISQMPGTYSFGVLNLSSGQTSAALLNVVNGIRRIAAFTPAAAILCLVLLVGLFWQLHRSFRESIRQLGTANEISGLCLLLAGGFLFFFSMHPEWIAGDLPAPGTLGDLAWGHFDLVLRRADQMIFAMGLVLIIAGVIFRLVIRKSIKPVEN